MVSERVSFVPVNFLQISFVWWCFCKGSLCSEATWGMSLDFPLVFHYSSVFLPNVQFYLLCPSQYENALFADREILCQINSTCFSKEFSSGYWWSYCDTKVPRKLFRRPGIMVNDDFLVGWNIGDHVSHSRSAEMTHFSLCFSKVRFLARSFSVPGNHLGQQSNGYRWPYGPVSIIFFFLLQLKYKSLWNQHSNILSSSEKLLLCLNALLEPEI